MGTYISIALQHNFVNIEQQNEHSYHKFNEENIKKFQELIENENWDEYINQTDTQTKYDKFIHIYSKHYETAFPQTKSNRTKKQRKNHQPWILPWLQSACDRKNKLFYTYTKNPTTENKLKYNKMKKFVKKHITIAKNKYYKKYFEKHSANSRKQWEMINSLLNRKKAKQTKIHLQDDDGNMLKDPEKVANEFNNYFTTIADKLKTKTHTTGNLFNTHRAFLKNPVHNSIYLQIKLK